jgi:hypothetical protein
VRLNATWNNIPVNQLYLIHKPKASFRRCFHLYLLVGAMLLVAGCNRPPAQITSQIRALNPGGWKISTGSGVIVLRRETPVTIMGIVGNPPRGPDESIEHYFRTCGQQIHYEVRVRFVPRLAQSEYEKMKLARQQAAAKFEKGASGRIEYNVWHNDYTNCQVPEFFTKDYSIFVDRWADRAEFEGFLMQFRFIQVYPPEAATEIEAVIKSLGTVFEKYETAVN